MKRTFDPWVGNNYWRIGHKGLRVLLLGESHYGETGTETSSFTQEIVTEWGKQKRHRFFTGSQKLVTGLGAGIWVSKEDRCQFWESIAFYNYVQSFVGGESRIRPTLGCWKNPIYRYIEGAKTTFAVHSW